MQGFVIRLLTASAWGGAAALAVWALCGVLRRVHVPSRYLCWLWGAAALRFVWPGGIPVKVAVAEPELLPSPAAVQALGAAPAFSPLAAAETPVQPVVTVWHFLFAVWLAGAAALVLRGVWQYARLRRSVALACKTPDGCYGGVSVPFTLGILRPRIYMPDSLSGAQRAAVLLHEQTHIRRRDTLVKPLFSLLVCLHWFNPLAWLACRAFTRTMESACDEAAVQGMTPRQRNGYCESIFQFAVRGPGVPGALAFGHGSVRARILHLLRYRRLSGAALAVCAGVVAVCCTACMLRPTLEKRAPAPVRSVATPESAQPAPSPTPEPAPARFANPVDYTYISRYRDQAHRGDDLCAPYGADIRAAESGTVTAAGYHYSYGNYAVIYHGADDGYGSNSLYAHMSEVCVEQGQAVARGEVIGKVGSTGTSTGNHLHFELYCGGVLMEPRYFTDYPGGDALPLTEEKLAEVREMLEEAAKGPVWTAPVEQYDSVSAAFDAANHPAVDLAAPEGGPVLAAADGVVTEAGFHPQDGNCVALTHSGGYVTRYCHLGGLSVQAGQAVIAGQGLGSIGSTGESTGPHLHLALTRDGIACDPLEVIPLP